MVVVVEHRSQNTTKKSVYAKTYNTKDSLVVTDPTTDSALNSRV